MDLNDYQERARKTVDYPWLGNNPVYPALGLCGEAGEVAEKVKKLWRNHQLILTSELREGIEKEMGDTLWYLAALASEIDTTLSDIAQANLDKLADRQERGVIKSEGDNR